MVPITERLCTQAQADRLKELGVVQNSVWAWRGDILSYDPSVPFGDPVDWFEEGYAAAYDLIDLGVMLKSFGFYLSGPTFPLSSLDNPAQVWWADDINSITDFTADIYKGYGATEVQARAELLIKLVEEGKVPVDWYYYRPDKTEALHRIMRIYGKDKES